MSTDQIVAVSVIAVFVVALILGLVLAVVGARRARRARELDAFVRREMLLAVRRRGRPGDEAM